ncbi:MAG: APC family permease [Pseudomonadales bacterium]
MKEKPELARRINMPLLTLYGLGTILGAGIYVLIGKVAGLAGALAPLAFFLAAVIAGFTALSYSQLVVLYPKSAGEVVYIQHGFNKKWLSMLMGVLIISMGTVSSATLSNGFVGYIQVFVDIPAWAAITGLLLGFAALAMWGINESMWAAALMTAAEIVGLLIVVWVRGDVLLTTADNVSTLFVPDSWLEVTGIVAGAFLAFYAFIGFEDMVNVAEEVKAPAKTMPRAILVTFVVSTLLYLLIALIAVQALTIDELAQSDAPLTLLIETSEKSQGKTLSFMVAGISLLAIINGVLVQIIMASRVLYGMAAQGQAPAYFARVNPRTATPIAATGLIVLLVLVASLWLPLVTLAKMTSFVVLIIFSLVNIALWKIERKEKIPVELQSPHYPRIGALLCLALLAFQIIAIFK